jgi:hypothetical protein
MRDAAWQLGKEQPDSTKKTAGVWWRANELTIKTEDRD